MQTLREEYETKLNGYRDHNRQKLLETNERMNRIEDLIIEEKEERIWETEQAVNEVRNSLDTV